MNINMLAIIVGCYLIAMILYGHYKGMMRLAVSLLALVITIGITSLVMPYASAFLKNHTSISSYVRSSIEKSTGMSQLDLESGGPSEQRIVIETLNLPQALKDTLIENNNSEAYQVLHVDQFADYVANYITEVVFRIISFIVIFILVWILLQVLMKMLDIVTKLPVIHGINQVAGAILGGIEGLIFFWIFCLIVMAASGTSWGSWIMEQINASSWLTFLFNQNILARFVLSFLSALI